MATPGVHRNYGRLFPNLPRLFSCDFDFGLLLHWEVLFFGNSDYGSNPTLTTFPNTRYNYVYIYITFSLFHINIED